MHKRYCRLAFTRLSSAGPHARTLPGKHVYGAIMRPTLSDVRASRKRLAKGELFPRVGFIVANLRRKPRQV